MSKLCENCQYPLIDFSSLDCRWCNECKVAWPWELKPGQKAILGGRTGVIDGDQGARITIKALRSIEIIEP